MANSDATARQQRTRDDDAGDPDVPLMLQVRDDVPGAFEVLVDRYQHRLIGILAHLTGDAGLAEALARQTLLRIHKTRKGYQPRGRFSAWVFGIAAGLARPAMQGKESGEREPDRPAGARGRATPERPMELSEAIERAVGRLDPDRRLAVLLAKFESLSYAEIAQVMKRSEPSVKSLLPQGRMQLRVLLEPHLNETRA